jgi:hypothetical protein
MVSSLVLGWTAGDSSEGEVPVLIERLSLSVDEEETVFSRALILPEMSLLAPQAACFMALSEVSICWTRIAVSLWGLLLQWGREGYFDLVEPLQSEH